MELIYSKINVHNLELLYRGSRDGFGSADFHSKCDNRPNTVSIIKTTKGYIFGGYTQVGWSNGGNEGCYSNDSRAFLFSLVNRFKKPFISEVVNPCYALVCNSNFGPVFGNNPNDICISNYSNTTTKSYSNGLSSFRAPNDIKNHSGYFFSDDKNFQVTEIDKFFK